MSSTPENEVDETARALKAQVLGGVAEKASAFGEEQKAKLDVRKSATHVLNEAVAAASKFKEDLVAKEAEKEKRDALFGGALPPPTAVTQQKVLQDAIKKAAEVQETQAAKANARKSFETNVLSGITAAATEVQETQTAKAAEKEKRDALFGGALPPPTAVTQQKVLQDAIKKAAEVQETQAAKASARKSFEANVLSGITAAATEVEATGEARRSHRKSFEASVLSELSDKVKSDEP